MVEPAKERPEKSQLKRIHPELCRRILASASRGKLRMDFLCETSAMLLDVVGCDAVEVRIIARDRLWCCERSARPVPGARQQVTKARLAESGRRIPVYETKSDLERVCEAVVLGRIDPFGPDALTSPGLTIGDAHESFYLPWKQPREKDDVVCVSGPYRSLEISAFLIERKEAGLIVFKSEEKDFFAPEESESFDHVAQILGIATAMRRSQVALRQRVKELTCLHGIAKLAAEPGATIDEIMTGAVELLREPWLHADIASVRIDLDGNAYMPEKYRSSRFQMTSDIVVEGEKRGAVTVSYAEARPELDEGPFLQEEREMLDVVAGEMALIVEARQMEEERENLREQLRHADRLATIGELAAGVAHELNEPLASILGRAQLTLKADSLPEQVEKDSEKIIEAALHSREIISKLRLFARYTPPQRKAVNLNDIVSDGLDLVEAQCAKAGITVVKELDAEVPDIMADPGQLYQVLINLVVNAMQATPDGGRITIRTAPSDGHVDLAVEDTGIGMDAETIKNIFTPFFTTKEVDEGTGLGLAVVHGIVSAHGGEITVKSKPGRGARFHVRLPVKTE